MLWYSLGALSVCSVSYKKKIPLTDTTSGLFEVKDVVEKSLFIDRKTNQFKNAEIYQVDILVKKRRFSLLFTQQVRCSFVVCFKQKTGYLENILPQQRLCCYLRGMGCLWPNIFTRFGGPTKTGCLWHSQGQVLVGPWSQLTKTFHSTMVPRSPNRILWYRSAARANVHTFKTL